MVPTSGSSTRPAGAPTGRLGEAVQLLPTILLVVALCLEVFSGHTAELGLPISPDRVLMLLALGCLTLKVLAWRQPRLVRWRAVHLAMLVALSYAFLSALIAGTFFTDRGFFTWFDQFGVFPFLLATLAPLVLHDQKQRRFLLVALTVVGAYLALTALFESLGLDALVRPQYILDPTVGYQAGRARGPFTESVALGMSLFMCGTASLLLASQLWARRRPWSLVAGLVTVLCAVGILLTLTRAVWLASVVGAAAALCTRRLRRFAPATAVAALLLVAGALVVVPGLRADILDRTATPESQLSVWDRYNTNQAAVRIVSEEPLTGIGWRRFIQVGLDYQVQAVDRPILYSPIDVHNVVLGYAAELGVLGAGLWLLVVVLLFARAVATPAPQDLEPWRIGLVAVGTLWFVTSNFGPVPYPFPNHLLWLWGGLVLSDYLSRDAPFYRQDRRGQASA